MREIVVHTDHSYIVADLLNRSLSVQRNTNLVIDEGTLEDLYYGNITPNAQDMAPNSELKRATDRVTRFENQLTERLDEAGQAVLEKLIEPPDTRPVAPFTPYKGKIRKSGTGCVTQINDHLWEGKFSPKWPDGKKHSRSIYASTEAECEAKLADLIRQMKAEIAEARRLVSEGNWAEAMALAGQKKARGTRKAV